MGDAGFGTRFVFASLAVWRVTHLLAEEDGPADAIVRLRSRLGRGGLGELMDCFYCLTIWAAAPVSFAVARRRRELPVTWLALSGAACLLERATGERPDRADIADWKGVDDGLLWQEEESIEPGPADAREPARRAEAAYCRDTDHAYSPDAR